MPSVSAAKPLTVSTFWVATSAKNNLFQFYFESVPNNVIAAVYDYEHGSGALCWVVLACVFVCMCIITIFAYKAYTNKSGDADDGYAEFTDIVATEGADPER